MTINSITLVGRNSEVALSHNENGSAFASFSITIKRGEQATTMQCWADAVVITGKLYDEAFVQRRNNGSSAGGFASDYFNGKEMSCTIPCEAWGKLAEKAATMEKGMLIGLIGSLTRDKKVRLDCLEILA